MLVSAPPRSVCIHPIGQIQLGDRHGVPGLLNIAREALQRGLLLAGDPIIKPKHLLEDEGLRAPFGEGRQHCVPDRVQRSGTHTAKKKELGGCTRVGLAWEASAENVDVALDRTILSMRLTHFLAIGGGSR